MATVNQCSPTVYIDGRRDLTGEAWSIFSDQISAVEVYSRSSTRCGGRLNWCYTRKWLPFAALVGLGFGLAVSF